MGLALIVIAHRSWILATYAGAYASLAVLNSGWLTWQFLPVPALSEHLALSMLYLQQTPPIPHLILGAFMKAFGWPVGAAFACAVLQCVMTTCATAGMFSIMCRLLPGKQWLCFFVCVVFALSPDILILEFNSLAQTFYENLAMMLTVGASMLFVNRFSKGQSARVAASLGAICALLALTRASFAYFFGIVLVIILMCAHSARRRLGAAFLLPVVLLVGGWSAKNAAVYGTFRLAPTSWTGGNFLLGLINTERGPELERFILAGREEYPDWFIRLIEDHGLAHWYPPHFQTYVPEKIQRADEQINARLSDSNRWENSIGQRLLFDNYMSAYRRFAMHNPRVIGRKFLDSYRLFWMPIRNYGESYLALFSVESVVHVGMGPAELWAAVIDGRVPERQLMMVGEYRDEGVERVPARFYTLDLAATAAYLLNVFGIHVLMPLGLVAVVAARVRRAPLSSRAWSFIFLTATYCYGAVVFNISDHGENVRFRLAVEPVIWCISTLCYADAWDRTIRLAKEVRARLRGGRQSDR